MLATVLGYFLITVEVICGLLLITVVLLQKTKSQGMGMAFGAGMGESLFGSQVGNVLTKVTVVLAIVFMANTTILAVMGSGKGTGSVADKFDAASAPAMPAGPQNIPIDQPSGSTPDTPASPVTEDISIPLENGGAEAGAVVAPDASEAKPKDPAEAGPVRPTE